MKKKATLLEKAHAICQRVQKRDGYILPKVIVDESRPIDAPLHNYFNWDDEDAAEKHRIWQARQLIKQVTIVFEKTPVLAYHSIVLNINNVPTKGYLSTIDILGDKDLRHQVIVTALRELSYWQEQYRIYTELDRLINQKELAALSKKYIKK